MLTISELERWVLFGAAWRMARSDGDQVTVEMLACTGELVERRDSADPDVVAYVRRVVADPRGTLAG